MPVYGKGRVGRQPKKWRNSTIIRVALKGKQGTWIEKRAKLVEKEEWEKEDSGLENIRNAFPTIIGQRRSNWLLDRYRRVNRPLVVLDWGCGTGRGIRELTRASRGKVVGYGYSKESYPQYLRTRAVKIIHETKEDLIRMVKDESVDWIYSHQGLHYLFPGGKPAGGVEYVKQLFKKIKPGGIISFTARRVYMDSMMENLKKAFEGKATVEEHVNEKFSSLGGEIHTVLIRKNE